VPFEVSLEDGEPAAVEVLRGVHTDRVWIAGSELRCRLLPSGDRFEFSEGGRREPVWVHVEHDTVFLHAFGRAWRLRVADSAERAGREGALADLATAPMPGTVVSVVVVEGAAVTAGEPLLVIESMKMQSEIVAWRDGTVERVHVAAGESFDRGAGLVALAPEA
jgi:3-methylcrotonyl-CoA carboxylase alpha subunit